MFWKKKEKAICLDEEMKKKAKFDYDCAKADLLRRGLEEQHQFEHHYHYGKEVKMTELAKLDALILAKKEMLEASKINFDLILKEKDKVILSLLEAIARLSKKEKEKE